MRTSFRETLATVPERSYMTGDKIIVAGTKTGRLFFLKDGVVAVSSGEVQISRIRETGAVFGEMSLLLDGPHTADVVALAPTTCHVVENAYEFLKDHPDLMAYVATVLAHRLSAVTRYLVDVKSQFADLGGHLGMIDEVIETMLTRHPRTLTTGR